MCSMGCNSGGNSCYDGCAINCGGIPCGQGHLCWGTGGGCYEICYFNTCRSGCSGFYSSFYKNNIFYYCKEDDK